MREQNQQAEQTLPQAYAEMQTSFATARMGAFLIVPLQSNGMDLQDTWLRPYLQQHNVTTSDMQDSVTKLLNNQQDGNILRRYRVPAEDLGQMLCGCSGQHAPDLYLCQQENRFTLCGMELFSFHTKVAFLCLEIHFDHMQVLQDISQLGYSEDTDENAEPKKVYYVTTAEGSPVQIDFEGKLRALCTDAGMTLFSAKESSVFQDAYLYTTAVVGQRFDRLDVLRQACLNLHLMVDLPVPAEDGSEEDINYVYAVKDQQLGSYRWGCCVTSQTISYVSARENLDLDGEMADQARDGLPVVLLALYQKYTCLRYQEILSENLEPSPQKAQELKDKLLRFQAYGTIAPANISRWHNIKQIYKAILDTNDVPEAIQKMDRSIRILTNQQNERSEKRTAALVTLVTLFSAFQIPPSLASIVEILGGNVCWVRGGLVFGLVLDGILLVLVPLCWWYRRKSK